MPIHPRDGGGHLSTSTVIVIAVVCGAVGILILTLFLWRLVARLFHRDTPAPLPPVQALAHHREAQAAAFSSRPTTWMDGSINGRSRHFLHPTSSSVSLIPTTPERKSSFYTDEVTTAESGYSLNSPLSNDDADLPLPHPRFFGSATGLNSPHASMHSMASSTTSSDAYTPPGGMTPSQSGSAPGSTPDLAATTSGSPLPSLPSSFRPPRTPPDVRPGSRPRPLSMISLSGSVHSAHTMRSNGTTIRGTPHGPLSNVQIIMPTPLAPQVHPYMHPLAGGEFTESARSSYVDQWVVLGGKPVTTSTSRKNLDNPPTWSSNSRRGHKRPSSSFTRSASPLGMTNRSLSQPRSSTSSPAIPPSTSNISNFSPVHPPIPPVPPSSAEVPLPEQPSFQNLAEEAGRGRSRTSRSNSLASSVHHKPLPTNPPASPPQVPGKREPSEPSKPRILRKQKSPNVS